LIVDGGATSIERDSTAEHPEPVGGRLAPQAALQPPADRRTGECGERVSERRAHERVEGIGEARQVEVGVDPLDGAVAADAPAGVDPPHVREREAELGNAHTVLAQVGTAVEIEAVLGQVQIHAIPQQLAVVACRDDRDVGVS